MQLHHSPSERKITGLLPCGLRRIASSANHKNNATLPTNNSARTRLFCGLGRRVAGLLPHHFLDHIVGRSHKRLVVRRHHRRHLLLVRLLALAAARVRQGWQGGVGLLFRRQRLATPRSSPFCNPLSPPRAVLPRRRPRTGRRS